MITISYIFKNKDIKKTKCKNENESVTKTCFFLYSFVNLLIKINIFHVAIFIVFLL